MEQTEPQSGIIPEPGAHASFLVLRAAPAASPAQTQAQAREIARIIAGAPRRTAALSKEEPRAKLLTTASFGSSFWDLISPARRPAQLHPFRAMAMDARSAVSTGGDVFVHVVSHRQDIAFELARRLRDDLDGLTTMVEEVSGFRYRDSRDLTGFIDGSENPKGKARAKAALIGDEDPDFRGGSYVFVQRYIHDLKRWSALSTHEQEGVIGRTKKDSTELPDKKKPPSAHIARVVTEENGEELQIVRHSFPYGNTTEAGLYFVAYMRELRIAEKMLRRMIGATEDGQHDRLLEFTRAVSGATFFAPSARVLSSFASR
jgi:putative iron-dependent peroxidase